jgi:hypothetical protein
LTLLAGLSVPSDNVNMLKIVGMKNGRIFMCGKDGSLYELEYQGLVIEFLLYICSRRSLVPEEVQESQSLFQSTWILNAIILKVKLFTIHYLLLDLLKKIPSLISLLMKAEIYCTLYLTKSL